MILVVFDCILIVILINNFLRMNWDVHFCLLYPQASGEKPETMSHKDAAMFPIIASAALFGLYVFFQVGVIMMLHMSV